MTLLLKAILVAAMLVLMAGVAGATDVKSNWDNHCAKCHGVDGKGQTKMGKQLRIGDYTDPKLHEGLDDAEMLQATLDGIKTGKKEQMPAYKDKLSEKECKELVAFVRSFKK